MSPGQEHCENSTENVGREKQISKTTKICSKPSSRTNWSPATVFKNALWTGRGFQIVAINRNEKNDQIITFTKAWKAKKNEK